jgi:hypothetical protein
MRVEKQKVAAKACFVATSEENSKQKWTVAVIITVTLTEILLNIQYLHILQIIL